MYLISHRGNINGPHPLLENKPDYIDHAIRLGFDVEVDVRCEEGNLYLGHDSPQYKIGLRWFRDRLTKLWVHCKNTEALVYFKELGHNFNYFWHEGDTVTLTSHNHIWAYPGRQKIKNSIAVLPELFNDDVSDCRGLCSDYILNYKDL